MFKILTEAAKGRGLVGHLYCLLLIAAVLMPTVLVMSPVNAQGGPPSPPAIYRGSVTISGNPAPVGTVIQAQINSVVRGNFTVSTAGSYGDMLVTDGNSGDTVQFYINGTAAQTTTFQFGLPVTVNLSTGGGGGGAPAAPVLSSPANGATGVSTTPTLQWLASSGATSYTVQVSISSAFTTFAFNQSGIAGTSATISPALTAATLYYWRANATNASGTSTWSTTWSFTTQTMSAPDAPTLLSPANSATGVTVSPLLQWSSVSGATSYTVQISTTSAFSSTVFSQSGLAATAITVSPALSSSTTYYWRANATGPGGTGAWSSTWNFTTTGGGGSTTVPAFFRGIAYKDGIPVNAKQVCATTSAGPTCVTSGSDGSYLVQVSGSTGDAVTFTVDGATALQTATFQPGWMTSLNLYATTGVLSVSTGSSTYATSTSAILNGTLGSLGPNTSATVSFDYGLTTSYGSTTSATTMSSAGSFTGGATGLTVGQTYHYRAKAVGSPSGTTVYGSDVTFVHGGGGSLAVSTTGGTYVSATTASFAGNLTSLGSDTSATVSFDYGTTTAYGSSTTTTSVASVGAFSITATGLTAGTTYHLRAKAVGPIGGTVYGSDVTYVHSASGSLGVSTGSGTYATSTSAVLGGTLTGLGTDSSASCSIEYGPTTSYGSTTSATTLSVAGSFTGGATGLVSGQTYHFRARATGSPSGSTVYGSDATYTHSGGCGSDPVGCTAGTIQARFGKYNAVYSKYTATASTSITKINVKCSASGVARVAIYSDNGGQIGSLLNANNASTAVDGGLNATSITIPSTAITAGTVYWLAVWTDGQIFGGVREESGIYAYQEKTADFTFTGQPTGPIYPGYVIRNLVSGSN